MDRGARGTGSAAAALLLGEHQCCSRPEYVDTLSHALSSCPEGWGGSGCLEPLANGNRKPMDPALSACGAENRQQRSPPMKAKPRESVEHVSRAKPTRLLHRQSVLPRVQRIEHYALRPLPHLDRTKHDCWREPHFIEGAEAERKLRIKPIGNRILIDAAGHRPQLRTQPSTSCCPTRFSNTFESHG